MAAIGFPILFATFVWWFGTGLVLFVVGMPRWTRRLSAVAFTGLLAGAVYVIFETSAGGSALSVYAAFTATIAGWAWVEVLFLSGMVTGPRRTPCPPGARGWARVRFAVEAIAWHEIALLVLGGLILWATWGGDNRIALWTFVLLWVMRLSAKLNLFLGVPVLNDSLLPEAVHFLRTYFRRRPASPLFPVSVAMTLAALAAIIAAATVAEGHQSIGLALLATLLGLALLEHLFMLVPLPLEAAWNWGKRSGSHAGQDQSSSAAGRRLPASDPPRPESRPRGSVRAERIPIPETEPGKAA